MVLIRSARAAIAALWLACHVGLFALVPIVLLADRSYAADCTCPGGGDAPCPMHHKFNAPSRCALRASGRFPIAPLPSSFAEPAVLTRAIDPIGLMPIASCPGFSIAFRAERPLPPDPPPPRA